ncbi:MAG TPA: NUDIX domain-containing protein [Acidimicrobiia bacterium]|nr:NUDIX domain-containing protein [Acidimicrobiia bacterium]
MTIGEDLRRRLKGYGAVDGEEEDAVDAVLALLGSESPFSAERFEPGHITASAFVLHPDEPALALILHAKIGRWLQPGGHVEVSDSSIVAAALREIREEIGVGPGDEPWLCDVDVHVFPARHDVPRHLHHDVRVAFTADSELLVAGEGADEARWWHFDEAAALERSVARPAAKLAEWRRNRN